MLPILTAPTFAPAPRLRVDGVLRHLGDVAVLPQREAFTGTLSWSLEVEGMTAQRLLSTVPALPSGHPGPDVRARLLNRLHSLLLRPGSGRPRFALVTIDRVEVGPNRARLVGTCAPILPIPRSASAPTV